MNATARPLLQKINDPADLRALPKGQLHALADELRAYVLESVSQTGGHLSSNLGTVELTVALHYVFNTPYDRIVWDVGHQTYPHKILTGRRDRMGTLRQLGGISGFPVRSESPYDTFGTAHSSTSISAALGMAMAAKRKGEKRRAIAVIGDGAMTAGMAFEAMNNAGVLDGNLLVILNDNDMSISPPVGALNRYLAQLMSGQFYAAARDVGKSVLKNVPPLLELAKKLEQHAKGMVVPATLFENFGFNYIGPIDGHDLDSLIPTLENIRQLDGPQFLHVVTKKGQGYKLAEIDPVTYHGPGKFDPQVGIVKPTTPPKPTFTQVFGQWLCDMAAQDKRLVGITPAMREGSGMVEFHQRFPERYYDVGIAEQHAVTFAAGLACEDVKPVVAIYSTFLQRAYDQLIHDVALQKLPMVLALDRAGIVGADGATHAGAYDIAFVRCIPNMSLACPADERECRQLLCTAYEQDHPVCVRYPRGAGVGVAPLADLSSLPFGKGEVRRQGEKNRHSGLWHLALPRAGSRRQPERHGRQYALGQTAGYRIAARTGRQPRRAGHAGRRLHPGRRRQRGAGSAGPGGPGQAGAATGPARSVYRTWRPGQAAEFAGAGCRRYRSQYSPAVWRGRLIPWAWRYSGFPEWLCPPWHFV